VEERKVSIDEIVEGAKSGSVTEAFGTGTAAVVRPWARCATAKNASPSATARSANSPSAYTTR
jgi:hypothetical protein